jgi:hypothetical protein
MKTLVLALLATAAGIIYGQTSVDLRTQSRNVDFGSAASTRPLKTGSALPATCLIGELYFHTGSPPGKNIFTCTAANTWKVLGDFPVVPANSGQFLTNDGVTTQWQPLTGDIASSSGQITVQRLQGRSVSSAAPANGDIWQWSSGLSRWEPKQQNITSVFGRSGAIVKSKGDYSLVDLGDVSGKQGTGSTVQMFGGGSVANGDCAKFDSAGNIVGGSCGSLPEQENQSNRALFTTGTSAEWRAPGAGIVVDPSKFAIDDSVVSQFFSGAQVPSSCTAYGLLFFHTGAPSGGKLYYCNGSTYEQTAGLRIPGIEGIVKHTGSGNTEVAVSGSDYYAPGTPIADTDLSDNVPRVQPADDQIAVGNGSAWQGIALPNCPNAITNKLLYDASTNTFSCGTDQNTGGGSGGSSFDPTDMTTFWFREDFEAGTSSGFIAANFSGGFNATVNVGSSSITTAPGVLRIGSAASPVAASGSTTYRAQTSGTTSHINTDDLTSKEWTFKVRFKLNSTSDMRFRSGLCASPSSSIAPATDCIQLRYDSNTSFGDEAAGKWVAQLCGANCNGSNGNVVALPQTADTNWHVATISRAGTTISVQIDSNPPVTFCASGCNSTVSGIRPSIGMTAYATAGTNSTVEKFAWIDAIAFKMAGLPR